MPCCCQYNMDCPGGDDCASGDYDLGDIDAELEQAFAEIARAQAATPEQAAQHYRRATPEQIAALDRRELEMATALYRACDWHAARAAFAALLPDAEEVVR